MKYPDAGTIFRCMFISLCLIVMFNVHIGRAGTLQEADSLQSSESIGMDKQVFAIPFIFSPFDSISNDQYWPLHTYSLDHFLEAIPGFVVNRAGPIGADAFFSRYGAGAGRGTVYMDGIPINDPQNDRAPLTLFPTSSINNLLFNHNSPDVILGRSGLEGSVAIGELEPLSDRPFTAIELSKGTNNLRQRRVRFSSARSRVGIDMGYDELLNDGIPYDPEIGAVDFGRSNTRCHMMNLRGLLPSGESYFFSFRWFRDVFRGQLTHPAEERRRSGHYAVASTNLDSWRFTLYERDYDVSLPDSHTVNHTTGLYTRVKPLSTGRLDSELTLGVEDIHSQQTIGGASGSPKLRTGSIGGHATVRGWKDIRTRFEWALANQHRGKTGWGGRTTLSIPLAASHEISMNAGRSFRLPNLGERFLPLHDSPAAGVDRIMGNRNVDPEMAWEAGVRIRSKVGFLESEVRFTGMQVEDAITFQPVLMEGETWLIPGNGTEERMNFFEGRWNAGRSFFGTEFDLGGGVVHAIGDRKGFFSSVPRTRVDASFSISRDLFKATSEILFITEYQYTTARRAFPGGESPEYSILNLKLDARLLDAHLYLLYLNVLDENYRTAGPSLLTPRTFVYGVQWIIFN
ncbi:MAG: TonB-dependent receptor plug domain-containing protein [Candidatus Latescibacterota bacterium]